MRASLTHLMRTNASAAAAKSDIANVSINMSARVYFEPCDSSRNEMGHFDTLRARARKPTG